MVVPCSRWVRTAVRTSCAVPAVKDAPPPPWLCMSTKPGTSVWPVRSTAMADSGTGPSGPAVMRVPSTVIRPPSTTPDGSTTRAPVSTVR